MKALILNFAMLMVLSGSLFSSGFIVRANARYHDSEVSHCNFFGMCYLCKPENELLLGEG